MPNVNKIITMTSVGSNSGPNYNVYYSSNCTDYTLISSSVSLPYIGSSLDITVPDTTNCIKLVNTNGICDNDVVVWIGSGTTTTTSTTSTTSTTTTVAPTTTTTSTTSTSTTTQAPVIEYWSGSYCNNGQQVPTILKATSSLQVGNVVNFGSLDPSTCVTLTQRYYGTPFVSLSISKLYSDCNVCQGITTTTTSTSTSTTTTTATPVWYSLAPCDNPTQVGQYTTQVPSGTFSNGQIVVYGNTRYFTVGQVNYANPGGTQWLVNASGLSNCPTTTTTTTIAPTTTTTTGGPTKYTYLRYDVDTNTCTTTGSPLPVWSYLNFASGFYKIESDPTLYYLQVVGHTDLTFQFLSAITASCTTTTTTIAPTTTTTTLQPGYFRALNCGDLVGHVYSTLLPAGTFNSGDRVLVGGLPYVIDGFTTTTPEATYTFTATGLFGCPATTTTTTTQAPALTVTNSSVTCNGTTGGWRSSFTGGSGTYSYVAYSNSQANAASMVNSGTGYPGARVTLTPGDTFYDWSGIANGTWWVAVKDSNGNVSVQNVSVVVNCVTTTTTTTTQAPTTTTTTTASPGGTAYVSITNQMFGGTITDVQVNGVSIVGASFPLAIGDGTSGTTDQLGLDNTVRVYYSGATPSPQYVQVTDTALLTQCNIIAGTSNRLFTNITIVNNGVVDVFAGDGNCP